MWIGDKNDFRHCSRYLLSYKENPERPVFRRLMRKMAFIDKPQGLKLLVLDWIMLIDIHL